MKWRLGLRNPEYINIAKLGLKCINLSRNKISDRFVEVLCRALQTDTYIKSIALRNNKITGKGIKEIQAVSLIHPRLLSVDLNENPGEGNSQHFLQIMKYAFLKNIKSAINLYHKDGSRIKLEWVHPSALGQFDNDLNDKN